MIFDRGQCSAPGNCIYRKERDTASGRWHVYRLEDGPPSTLEQRIATLQTETFADLFVACLERSLHEAELVEVPFGEGAPVIFTFEDGQGVPVESGVCRAREAGFKALRFLVLHGGDPDGDGRGAQAGSISFVPAPARRQSHE